MIRDEILLAQCYSQPAQSLDRAIERVQVFAQNSLFGLIGMKFLGSDQLRRALAEIGYNLSKSKDVVSCGPITSSLYIVMGTDGSLWKMLLTEGEVYADITNVQLDKVGDSTQQADHDAVEETLNDQEEDNG